MTTTHDHSVTSRVQEFLRQGRKILIRIERSHRPIPKRVWKQWRNQLDALPIPTDVYDPIAYRILRMKENDRLVSRFDVLVIQRKVRRYFADDLASPHVRQLEFAKR